MTLKFLTGILCIKEATSLFHYSIFNGVSILQQQLKPAKRQNNTVLEVAHFLERKAY